MSHTNEVIVRPLSVSDRSEWSDLWGAYLGFYGTERPKDIHDAYFARLLGDDPQDFNGLVAEQDGKLVGLTHYLFHRHGWSIEKVCYLQDLFADLNVRGTGVGRKLIEGVYAAADAAGAPSVYWLTQAPNIQARVLYDQIGTLTPFVKYQRV
jgi:GNAT superfamily N-acetyltransferase